MAGASVTWSQAHASLVAFQSATSSSPSDQRSTFTLPLGEGRSRPKGVSGEGGNGAGPRCRMIRRMGAATIGSVTHADRVIVVHRVRMGCGWRLYPSYEPSATQRVTQHTTSNPPPRRTPPDRGRLRSSPNGRMKTATRVSPACRTSNLIRRVGLATTLRPDLPSIIPLQSPRS